jgi:uncharacterized repeat protein (TIGR01451 family)
MILKTYFYRKIILVMCCLVLMMSLLGLRAQAGTLAEHNGSGLTAPEAPEAVIPYTTVADFDQACATKTNTHVSDNLGGSVELAGAFNDNFGTAPLDTTTRWQTGSWAGGTYTPVVSGGKLTLPPGGYVRSKTATFNRGVLETTAEFSQGTWQQLGFGSADLDADLRYLFFSTLSITTTQYARLGLMIEYHDEDLLQLLTGSHRYKLSWQTNGATTDLADYYIDNTNVYTSFPFTNTLLSNMYVWMSNNGTNNLVIDEMQVAPPYAGSGTYISCPLDATSGNIWQSAAWVSALPTGTSMTVQTRTSPDGNTWTGWTTVANNLGSSIASPNRYMQYQLLMGTSNVLVTPALDSITLTTTGNLADLSLSKTASTTTPDVGSSVNFTITLNNGGPNAATGVEVTDILQPGYTYSTSSATLGSYNNTSHIWSVGTIPASSNAVLTITAVVNTAGPYSNAAEVTKSDVFDPDSTPNNGANGEDDYATITLTPVQLADLVVTKTDNPDPAVAGTDLTYVVTVQNLGPSNASTVVFTDTLPSGVNLKSVTQGSWICTTPVTGKVRCTIASLGVTSSNVSIVATVKPDTRGSINNQVDVKSATVDRVTNNNTYQQNTTITTSADLELTKVARSTTPIMGSTEVFTVTVTNKGPSQATGVTVGDLLATGYQFSGATPGQGTYDQNTGVWNVGALTVNQSVTLRLSGTVKTSGTYNNYAQVTASNEPDPDSTPNNGSTTEDDDEMVSISAVPGADLSLVKQASNSSPYVGETVVFTVTVANAGPNPATGVVVKDLLNNGFTFISSSQPGSYNAQTGMWTVGTLQVAENKQLMISAQINPTGSYQNIAEVWQSQVLDPDSTPGNSVISEDDYGAVTLSSVQIADLSIEKTLLTPRPELGKDILFEIRVINSGPSDAGSVTIKDVLPANHSFISSDHTAVYDSGAGTLTWNLGTIAANGEVIIQVTLQASETGIFTNQVEVMTSSVVDPDSTPGNGALGEDDLSSLEYRVSHYIFLPLLSKKP